MQLKSISRLDVQGGWTIKAMRIMTSLAADRERSHRTIKNVLLAMKITTFLLLVGFLQLSAEGLTQTVSLSVKEERLDKVFAEIKQQTGYSFFYTDDQLQKAKSVTVKLTNVTLEQALDAVFSEQPFSYQVIDKMIVIKPKQVSPNADATNDQPSLPATVDISGKVINEEGNPLEGASVKVKGTDNGTTTNSEGVFVLKTVDEKATLEISFIGYQAITIPVNKRTSITASLKIQQKDLSEVIINKGYYTEKEKLSVWLLK